MAAHTLFGEPPWLFVVAPPSSLKTEVIRALDGYSGTYSLSDITARTFVSGLEGKRNPSLLNYLKEELLLFKDFTTVLTKRHDERQEVLAQLREIHDGSYKKTFGNGKRVEWKGKLGFIGGVTPVIDTYTAVTAVLEERFVLYRPFPPDRQEVARKAQANSGLEMQMRQEIADAFQGFLSHLALPAALPGP